MMFDELAAYLKKPGLYERTPELFWNDPHISSQMLEAHLNPDTDAASRNPGFIESAVEWISALVPEGASLMDIGCGPGLYTKRFAQKGLRVTGMDFSERSIRYAREHDPKSEYVFRDYLTIEDECAFDIITLIWCDYGALTTSERENLLKRVYRALRPGGMFLFDVFTPSWFLKHKDTTSWVVCEQGGFWSPNPHICLDAHYHYEDGRVELCRTVVVEKGAIRCYNIWDTFFTKQQLLGEAAPFGFGDCQFFSDVAGKPYSGDSKTLCAVMTKN